MAYIDPQTGRIMDSSGMMPGAGVQFNTAAAPMVTGGFETPAAGSFSGDQLSGAANAYVQYLNQVAASNERRYQDALAQAKANLAMAQNADQRQQALLDMQRAQQEFNQLQQQLQAQTQQIQFSQGRYDTARNQDLNRAEQSRQFDVNNYQNQRQYDLGRYDKNRQFEEGLYSSLAQNLLNNAVQLGQRPEDYFAYNQALSGGRSILDQLSGNSPTAAFSAPTGKIQAGNTNDLVNALGISGMLQNLRRSQGPEPYIGPAPNETAPDLPFMRPEVDTTSDALSQMDALKGAWNNLIQQNGGQIPAANDPNLIRIFKSVFNLSDADARIIAQNNAEYYSATGRVIPDNVMAGMIATQKSYATNTNPTTRAGQLADQAYADALKGRGASYLSWTDPQVQGIYQNAFGTDQASAAEAARRAGVYFQNMGFPVDPWTQGQIVGQQTNATNNTNPGAQAVTNLNRGYAGVLAQRGAPYLSQGDPDLNRLYQLYGGLAPGQDQNAEAYAADTYRNGGVPIGDQSQYYNLWQRQNGQPYSGLGPTFGQLATPPYQKGAPQYGDRNADATKYWDGAGWQDTGSKANLGWQNDPRYAGTARMAA